ncbi:MAG: single-stranded-DNA-specific exonuclease RecJ [Clostridium argentinense]|uniref:Single-stranded-DNA-specific exonuclease RecJ n=1 Tax=Clostridium faecium TaxID=2762223 RepID=A0ABR8YPC2_9CLOT|nr:MULTISPECIES: single-stranded-DNA-specific exonuclease RecJ [Clostridium]MBD8045987.1 single-stranded-DNA-specific exonuclease RecJ [Clostridium faecium]MBS5823942.1 single-stranded-DNA-specific exonuclease RecJ [Clostridium argentinense]MDU1349537.1 single-stranded-DNA-specific exonuclease RecJ [Clostridium argentinense]
MESRWMLRTTKIDVKSLAKKVGLNPITVKVMVNRGINTVDKINKFINTTFSQFHNPFLMKDMEKGVSIIKNAIEKGEKIMIYGDYDADGVTSTVILYKALKRCNGDVAYYIPDRENEGYGMCSERIEKIKEDGYNTIISCDNGISALEQVERAKELGMTVVITDHHELPFEDINGERLYKMPVADAVINPKRNDCEYPFKSLCGAGIVFKFSCALYKSMGIPVEDAYELIEIAGIGTICDVVDLVDENRVIAKEALRLMNDTKNTGLKALKEILNIRNTMSSYHVGFLIGPCINATGRLETAFLSADLLLCEDVEKAKELASTLVELNKKRQEMTNDSVEAVMDIINNSSFINDKVLVVYKEDIHESIAGIVAGRIRETYNVPTIILTKGKDMPKGSGRSIEEYNMFEELIKCKDLLHKFGGHPMAAGLSIKEENIKIFREKLNEVCKLSKEDLIPKIRIDERLPLKYIDFNLIEELHRLEPFGKGNNSPILADKNIPIERISILGEKKNTLKFRCRIPETNKYIDAICFNRVDEFIEMLKNEYGESYEYMLENPKGMKMDMVFSPSINEYNGNVSLQLKINNFKISN